MKPASSLRFLIPSVFLCAATCSIQTRGDDGPATSELAAWSAEAKELSAKFQASDPSLSFWLEKEAGIIDSIRLCVEQDRRAGTAIAAARH